MIGTKPCPSPYSAVSLLLLPGSHDKLLPIELNVLCGVSAGWLLPVDRELPVLRMPTGARPASCCAARHN